MWKKCIVFLITILSISSIAYGFYNLNLLAAPVSDSYYGPGDVFERTNKNTFTMGGLEWSIIYADTSTGKGYILGQVVSRGIHSSAIPATLQAAQSNYDASTNDDAIGKTVRANNDVSIRPRTL